MGVVDKLGKIFVSDCTYLGGNEIKYFLVSFFFKIKNTQILVVMTSSALMGNFTSSNMHNNYGRHLKHGAGDFYFNLNKDFAMGNPY